MSSEQIDYPGSFIVTTSWQNDDIINFPRQIFDFLDKDIDPSASSASICLLCWFSLFLKETEAPLKEMYPQCYISV